MSSSGTADEALDQEIDVVVLTRNSEYLLQDCLISIYQNIPVKKLIIVDGLSTDNTLSIIDDFDRIYGNVKVIEDSGTRATARELGIRNIDTDWFLFVDSDVILCKDWFRRASKYTGADVGAIWGPNIDVIQDFDNRVFYRLFRHVSREAFKIRGGMHDTLIRLNAVKDIRIPPYLHTYEDAHIVRWIERQGYSVIIGDDVYCLHIRPPEDWGFKESLSLASCEIKCGLGHFKAFKYILYYPFFAFYWLLQRYKNLMRNRIHRRSN